MEYNRIKNMDKKFINSWIISDFEIETDTGWENIVALHETIPYIKYIITTESGLSLEAADRHILFDENYNEVYIEQLCIGDKIITKNGVEQITYINNTGIKENMYDFELPEESNHRYYSNEILSHNTMIARTIAKMLDVPFCVVDATVLTESGYVGEDVESSITRLLQAADYDVEKAERGIIFIDEIDKIARKSDNPSITRDVSGEGVQQGLLKLLEGSIVNVAPNGGRKHPDQKYVQVNTKNILFICAGAFEGIEKRIASRMNKKTVGFGATIERMNNNIDNIDEEQLLSKVTVQDIKKFGLIPEILGRLPVITYTQSLDKEVLIRILNEPKNALVKQYIKLFEMDGIKLTFDDDVFEYIADKAIKNKIGARGLRGIMEDLMAKAMFEMPTQDIKEFNVTLEYAKEKLEEND